MMCAKKLRCALVALMLVAAGMLGFYLFSSSNEDVWQEPYAGVSNVSSQVIEPSQAAETTLRAVDQGGEASLSKSPEKHEESEMRKSAHESVAESERLLQAATEFKANPGFRVASAGVILPHLTNGMTAEEIVRLLGEPTEKKSDGTLWIYTVFYSQIIEVHFNPRARVERVFPVGIEADK